MENLLSTWVINNLGLIGAAAGVIDFLITGGRSIRKESPVPMVFSGAFELSGTAETKEKVFQLSFQTPGTIHKYPNFIPLYDKPLGIFNLTKTPVLQYRRYWQQTNNPNLFMQYYSYKVKDSILYAVNPHLELQVSSIEAAIVFRLDSVYKYPYSNLPGINDWLNQGIYEIESSTDGKYVLRTRYIPYEKFKNTIINVPPGTDITIKIKAELRRINAPPGTQPVLFVADYEPKFEFDSGTTPFSWLPCQLPSSPLTLNISGLTYLNPGQTGTFTANPSGGSGTYINYKWWIRNDETSIEPYAYKRKTGLITPSSLPQGGWIYMPYWEGRQTITLRSNYDFSLKCEVIDPCNNTATDIHSVDVGGASFSNQDNQDNNAVTMFISTDFSLSQNYPNPFNPETEITFGLPEPSRVTITITDILGREVLRLVHGDYSAGYHRVRWDGTDTSGKKVGSGIYFYRITAVSESGKRFNKVMKMVLAR